MYNNHKGFTLVEMLVVIVIIGIISAAVIPRIIGATARARDVARKYDLTELSQAMNIYSIDYNGVFPAAFPPGSSSQTTINSNLQVASLHTDYGLNRRYLAQNISEQVGAGGSVEYIAPAIQGYLGNIPSDPTGEGIQAQDMRGDCKPGSGYAYRTSGDQSSYALTAQLESKNTGNTDNCGGIINQKQGDYFKLGEGLEYEEWVLTYDPEVDGNPKSRCEEQLKSRPDIVDELRYSINQGELTVHELCNSSKLTIRRDIDGRMPKGVGYLAAAKYLLFVPNEDLKIDTAIIEGCFHSIFADPRQKAPNLQISNIVLKDGSCLLGGYRWKYHQLISFDFGTKPLNRATSIIFEDSRKLERVTIPDAPNLKTLYVYFLSSFKKLDIGFAPKVNKMFVTNTPYLTKGGFGACHLLKQNGWISPSHPPKTCNYTKPYADCKSISLCPEN